MTINIKEVLPLLDTIFEQQKQISERLQKLVETFQRQPEPVEPKLRSMLQPINTEMELMQETLSNNS